LAMRLTGFVFTWICTKTPNTKCRKDKQKFHKNPDIISIKIFVPKLSYNLTRLVPVYKYIVPRNLV